MSTVILTKISSQSQQELLPSHESPNNWKYRYWDFVVDFVADRLEENPRGKILECAIDSLDSDMTNRQDYWLSEFRNTTRVSWSQINEVRERFDIVLSLGVLTYVLCPYRRKKHLIHIRDKMKDVALISVWMQHYTPDTEECEKAILHPFRVRQYFNIEKLHALMESIFVDCSVRFEANGLRRTGHFIIIRRDSSDSSEERLE